ncbi:MAG: MerR family transcriptional regulator [Candidatus Hydrogenedentes bacterium]|nr:MerR family transcriptional regulator [Candidatus Hydrogenedentota bacterium]
MKRLEDRQYSISEVSRMTEVPKHVLRQWEARFSKLRPGRSRTNRRMYRPEDVDIVRRLKQLLWVEGLTTEGARIRLAEELIGQGRPKTRQEAINLVDKIESEVRALLDLLNAD